MPLNSNNDNISNKKFDFSNCKVAFPFENFLVTDKFIAQSNFLKVQNWFSEISINPIKIKKNENN